MKRFKFSARRLKLIVVAVVAIAAFFGFYNSRTLNFRATANSSGAPAGHSGAPGESNCTACHSSFPVNSGGGSIVISGLPANYAPGQTIPLTLTVNQPNATIYGFQTTALDNANLRAGDFTTQAQSPQQVQVNNGSIGGVLRRYAGHTINGLAPPPMVFGTKSWNFNWVAPTTRRGKVTFHAAGNGANSDGGPGGDQIMTNSAFKVCSGSVGSNFDGDGRGDVAVFRPSNGNWFQLNSSNGNFVATNWGLTGDKIVPGDFDGDGKNDRAVWRPSNSIWYISQSSNGQFVGVQFGQNGDLPVTGDFTGDGKTDLAVFRPSNGTWYTFNLVNNAFTSVQWGVNGDKPISGDFDGDGKNDLAVWRPSNGVWYVLRSSDSSNFAVSFGINGDKPTPGDFDGDGKTDVAVFRPSNGIWYRLNSSDGNFVGIGFGQNGDLPAPTDYDGDCQTDLAVFRNNIYYILQSSNNAFLSIQFGQAGDIPIASGYIPE